jgi:hypothetical protein
MPNWTVFLKSAIVVSHKKLDTGTDRRLRV